MAKAAKDGWSTYLREPLRIAANFLIWATETLPFASSAPATSDSINNAGTFSFTGDNNTGAGQFKAERIDIRKGMAKVHGKGHVKPKSHTHPSEQEGSQGEPNFNSSARSGPATPSQKDPSSINNSGKFSFNGNGNTLAGQCSAGDIKIVGTVNE